MSLGDDPSERRFEPPSGVEWEEWAIYFYTSDPAPPDPVPPVADFVILREIVRNS